MFQRKTRISVVERAITQHARRTRTMTVVRVVRVLANGWVELEPQIQLVARNSETGVEKPIQIDNLLRVPVGYYKAGGFVQTFPTAVGDEGIVVCSDRSLDTWKKTGKAKPPIEYRMHDLSDSVFMPFPTSNDGAIQNYDPDGFYVGKEDKSAYVRIGQDGKIELVSGVEVEITAPQNTINGVTTINGATTITDTLSVSGIAQFDLTIIAAGAVTAADFGTPGGVTYLGHKHNGVQVGSDNSGGIV